MIGDGDLRLHYRAKKRKKKDGNNARAGRQARTGWRGVIRKTFAVAWRHLTYNLLQWNEYICTFPNNF
jgi:hypothetical protein